MTVPRVLHVVESLDRGAVEGWLVRMLAHAAKTGKPADWSFYCVRSDSGPLEARAVALGAKIIRAPTTLDRKAGSVNALRAELRKGGYDVLHCHHDLVSGLYLLASVGLNLRRRLVHVHNADEAVLTPSRLRQRVYRPLLRQTCLALADRIVGISEHTLDTFLAGRTRHPGRDFVHYYGVDPLPFRSPAPDRSAFRHQLGLEEGALILLFGGRMVPEKNPVLTIDVLAELRRIEPNAVALFAGSGSQEAAVLERARALGIEHAVRLLGWRDDLQQVMRVADWFILPRPDQPMEGFGLAVVEAQLAGLHLLLSSGVPDDPLLPSASFRRLPVASPPGEWAKGAAELVASPPATPAAALQALANSPMDMDRALEGLLGLHA